MVLNLEQTKCDGKYMGQRLIVFLKTSPEIKVQQKREMLKRKGKIHRYQGVYAQ